MNDLMPILYKIQQQCADIDPNKNTLDEKDLDDFTRLKKNISRQLKEIRKVIEERNELLQSNGRNTTTVKLSSDIRNKLKIVQEDVSNLQQMQQQEATKLSKQKTPDEKKEATVKSRGEIVELCFKHIEECKHLEKQTDQDHPTGFVGIEEELPKSYITKLPDIDDEGFNKLRANDAILDEKLDRVSEGVTILNEMARNFDREIEMQDIMIQQQSAAADETNFRLNNLNSRMLHIIRDTRPCDRFVMDFILIIILLGIGAYIYRIVTSST